MSSLSNEEAAASQRSFIKQMVQAAEKMHLDPEEFLQLELEAWLLHQLLSLGSQNGHGIVATTRKGYLVVPREECTGNVLEKNSSQQNSVNSAHDKVVPVNNKVHQDCDLSSVTFYVHPSLVPLESNGTESTFEMENEMEEKNQYGKMTSASVPQMNFKDLHEHQQDMSALFDMWHRSFQGEICTLPSDEPEIRDLCRQASEMNEDSCRPDWDRFRSMDVTESLDRRVTRSLEEELSGWKGEEDRSLPTPLVAKLEEEAEELELMIVEDKWTENSMERFYPSFSQ